MWNYTDSSDPTLGNSLFGDIDKYKYSGYGIGFDMKGNFLFPTVRFGKNVINFGANMSSSVHVDKKEKRHFDS